ncbi:4323_t:CDS:2, partial [Gigaspora margarita]
MTTKNLHEEANRLKILSYVANTGKNTTKWLRHVDRYQQDLNEFELDYVNDSQQECSHGSTIEDSHDSTIEDFHNSTIEDSHDSTVEDFHDSTIEALQDLKDSVGAPCLQDSNFKEQNSQDSTQK